MAEYKIYFKPSVDKDLRCIPVIEIRKIMKRIKTLAEKPRPPGFEKLTDENKYRIRQGYYRIIYMIDDDELLVRVMKVIHRKDAYR